MTDPDAPVNRGQPFGVGLPGQPPQRLTGEGPENLIRYAGKTMGRM
ncbi:MAG: hypothetical protein LBJ82_03635 [Deltaproteobacteria bacterium]|nr:hypothetical protein [Deltaproteobacteria bacterium]